MKENLLVLDIFYPLVEKIVAAHLPSEIHLIQIDTPSERLFHIDEEMNVGLREIELDYTLSKSCILKHLPLFRMHHLKNFFFYFLSLELKCSLKSPSSCLLQLEMNENT